MATKTLTDTALKNLKPKDKLYKVSDGIVGGLQVAASTKGKITFRLAYKFDGKEQLLTLGDYQTFSLVEAQRLSQSCKETGCPRHKPCRR